MHKLTHMNDGTQRARHLAGWKRQPQDSRDFRLKVSEGYRKLPSSVDNRAYCSEVEDQGDLGSCTANGFAGLIEMNEVKAGRKVALAQPTVVVSNIVSAADGSVSFTTKVTPAAIPTPVPVPTLVQVGRLAHYYFTRQLSNTVSEDSGAYIRDAIKAGVQYGVSDESLWPYVVTKFATKPPKTVYDAAATHKVTSYHSIADGDITTMKSTLADGQGIIFGFDVYSYFMGQDMATSALLSVPEKGETLQGGHCVDFVGYNDTIAFKDGSKGGFLCRNSWGKNWGLSGYFWMSYTYVAQKLGLASDFWVVMSSPI